VQRGPLPLTLRALRAYSSGRYPLLFGSAKAVQTVTLPRTDLPSAIDDARDQTGHRVNDIDGVIAIDIPGSAGELATKVEGDIIEVAVIAVVTRKPLAFSEHSGSLPRRYTGRVAVLEPWRTIRPAVLVLRPALYTVAVPVDAPVPVIGDAVPI
jgi:hypothetical protein